MDRFLIITNRDKDKDYTVTNRIADYIGKAGRKAVLSHISAIRTDIEYAVAADGGIECAIVLGGDGTIIHTANDLLTMDIPILGVNLGTLGFLAEIEEQHVLGALDRLFKDDFRIESRLMLLGEIQDGQKIPDLKIPTEFALNDIVISRKGLSRIISLGIFVNNELVDNFRGDGVIISTPTGSTAYNLSAGGPIISPRAEVMVITPVCPHSLSPRSIVVSAEDTIKVTVGRSRKTQEAEASATFDGQKVVDMGTGDVILIKKAKYDTKLIKLDQTGFYEILRSKLVSNED